MTTSTKRYLGLRPDTGDHVPAAPGFHDRVCLATAPGATGDCVRPRGHDGIHQGAHRYAWIDVRTDAHGLPYVVNDDGEPMYVTDCHTASAKGSYDAVVCRVCYAEVDPSLGGIVEPLPEDDRPEWAEARARYDAFVRENMSRWLNNGRTGS